MVENDKKGLTSTNSYSSSKMFNSPLKGLDDKDAQKLSSLITQAGYTQKQANLFNYKSPVKAKHKGIPVPFLKEQSKENIGKKTLVVDLDETLVHSSFQPVHNADIIIPITLENVKTNVYVLVRPGALTFLE